MSNNSETQTPTLARKKLASNMWLCFFVGVAVAEWHLNNKLVKNFR